MKKKLFFAALAVVALASCTNEEILEVNKGEAISFRSIVSGNTRAADKTSFVANDAFNVWATYGSGNYFKQDYKFNGTDWRSTATAYYWPASVNASNSMTFDAIYPTSITRTEAATFSYTIQEAAADQLDVLYAKHVSTTKQTTGVPLNFRHTLSQIVVNTKNTSKTLEFVITGLKVAFVNKAGTFTYTGNDATDTQNANLAQTVWTATDGTATATSAFTQLLTSSTVAPEATATALGASWILLPQNQAKATAYTTATTSAMAGAYLAVKMQIQNATDHSVVATDQWCCFPIAIAWNPGYKYTYTIDLAGGGYKEQNDGETEDDGHETDLDPVLDNAEIFFVNCTIDTWDETTEDVKAPVTPAP